LPILYARTGHYEKHDIDEIQAKFEKQNRFFVTCMNRVHQSALAKELKRSHDLDDPFPFF